jgi:hypothetical protein
VTFSDRGGEYKYGTKQNRDDVLAYWPLSGVQNTQNRAFLVRGGLFSSLHIKSCYICYVQLMKGQ